MLITLCQACTGTGLTYVMVLPVSGTGLTCIMIYSAPQPLYIGKAAQARAYTSLSKLTKWLLRGGLALAFYPPAHVESVSDSQIFCFFL